MPVVNWKPAGTPPVSPDGQPVTVLAVVDDPQLRLSGDEPFVDLATWWPERKLWTVTHRCRADREVTDFPTRVVLWDELPAVPAIWS